MTGLDDSGRDSSGIQTCNGLYRYSTPPLRAGVFRQPYICRQPPRAAPCEPSHVTWPATWNSIMFAPTVTRTWTLVAGYSVTVRACPAPALPLGHKRHNILLAGYLDRLHI